MHYVIYTDAQGRKIEERHQAAFTAASAVVTLRKQGIEARREKR